MPDYAFAVLSAFLWAGSAPLINLGLQKISENTSRSVIGIGLFFSLVSGLVTAFFIANPKDAGPIFEINLILAGIFTFPLATGGYYLASTTFENRADLASIFGKIKPLFSFLLAVLILEEVVGTNSIASVTLIGIGTFTLIIAACKQDLNYKGVILGLLTALFWAFGEVFMKLSLSETPPVLANFFALMWGTFIYIFFLLGIVLKDGMPKISLKAIWPFCLHGILSFGLAYSLFFYSIERIGLAKSVLINAFWPILAIAITSFIQILLQKPVKIPFSLLLASIFLIMGSILQAFSLA